MGEEFADTKLFKLLKSVGPSTWEKVADVIAEGEDVGRTGTYQEGYLHVLAAPRPEGQHIYVLPIIYQLSEAGIDMNTVDREGNTALHICSLNDVHHSIVLAMIRCGSDPCMLNKEDQDAMDLSGMENMRTTLHYMDPGLWRCVGESNVDKCLMFMERWCKVSLKREGKKLLKLAGDAKNPEIKESLKKNKEHIQFVHACLSGNAGAVKEMLKKDVEVNCADPYHLREDATQILWPLFAEVLESNLIPIAKLLAKKVDANFMLDIAYGNTQPLFMWAIDATKELLPDNILKPLFKKADLNKVQRKCDLLHKLWKRDVDQELITILFPDGMPIGSRDQNGYTLRELIFLENIDDEEKQKENLPYVDKVVIDWAKEGKKDKLQELAYCGYEYINVSNRKGKSVSALAKKQEQKGVIKFLKKQPDLQSDLTEMMVALECANLQRAKEVLDEQSINYKDRGCRSPLHIAILYERKYCVKFILQNFPQALHFTDLFGRTALHYAGTMTGGTEFHKALVKAGGDPSLKDVYGYSSEDYIAQVDYNFLEEERTKDYGKEVYLLDRFFAMKDGIKGGDMDKVKEYRESMKTTKCTLNDIDRFVAPSYLQAKYRPLLFLCFDHGEIDIAKYLMEEGASVRIYATAKPTEGDDDDKEVVTLYDAACSLKVKKELIDLIKLKDYQEHLAETPLRDKYSAGSMGRNFDDGRSTSLSAYMDPDINGNGNGKQQWGKVKNTGQFISAAGDGVKKQDGNQERSGSSACTIL